MEVIEKACIPGILRAIARNVEGGKNDRRLYAEHRDGYWALWTPKVAGTWHFSIHLSAQFSQRMLVVELDKSGKTQAVLTDIIGDIGWQATDIVREVSAWFLAH